MEPQTHLQVAAAEHLPQQKARDLRLCRHADFQAVYKLARKQYSKEMTFFFARRELPLFSNSRAEIQPLDKGRRAGSNALVPLTQNQPVQGPRVGLTVGKVLGKAHDRNRIKRRLRAAVRQQASLLTGLPVDVVLHPRRTMLTLDWKVIESEVAQIFRTVRRLADKPQVPPPPRPPVRNKLGKRQA